MRIIELKMEAHFNPQTRLLTPSEKERLISLFEYLPGAKPDNVKVSQSRQALKVSLVFDNDRLFASGYLSEETVSWDAENLLLGCLYGMSVSVS